MVIQFPNFIAGFQAAIDPSLIVFLLIGLGSALSSWLQKKRMESEGEAPSDDEWTRWKELSKRERRPDGGAPVDGPPEQGPTRRRIPDWERELREFLGDAMELPKRGESKPRVETVSDLREPDPPPYPVLNAPYEPPVIVSGTTRGGSEFQDYESAELPAFKRDLEAEELDLTRRKKQAAAFVKSIKKADFRKLRRRSTAIPNLKTPQGIRQAMVASFILGKPKALENPGESRPGFTAS